MLTHIHIKDLAIVSSLALDLRPGMTALTGETGAGKSILIDALGLALGDRADKSMIRAGSERAEITAVFDIKALPEVTDWLMEQAIDTGDECILRRVLVRNGRSRTFINSTPVPVQALQGLGQLLVDIHGQHAHQSLLRRGYQRNLLDAYAGDPALVDRVAQDHNLFNTALTELTALQEAALDRTSRLELVSFQVQELQGLNLGEQEIDELDRDHARLSNIGKLQGICTRVIDSLYEDDHSVQNRMVAVGGDLEQLVALDDSLKETGELLDSAAIQIQEAAAGLRDYLDSLELDPALLEQIEERLTLLHDLARKYRVQPRQLPERLAELERELGRLQNADLQLESLAKQVQELSEQFFARAQTLSKHRRKAAKQLSETVTETMQRLSMAGGRFSVELQPVEPDKASAAGLERVEFMVSANPGQPLQPLARVASGGEISRISLAIQVATAECGKLPTLIFDEVDVGIGGGVAEIVGQMLKRLGTLRQILCVTHLPQVAAMGHHHLRVAKRQTGQETHTGISMLEEEQRINEIARMLGGLDITDQTLAHAREMVAHSQEG